MRKLSAQAQARGLRVEKLVIGYAYAKNGNTHNPTPRVMWVLKNAAGLIVDSSSKLSELLSTADEIEA